MFETVAIASPGLVLGLAVLFDLLLGEMPAACHPVVWMGRLTGWLTRSLPEQKPRTAFWLGTLVTLSLATGFTGATLLLLAALAPWPLLQTLVAVWLLKSTFALRELGLASRRVGRALGAGRLDEARLALRSLCSRDPRNLQEAGLASAAAGSVAENLSDSFIAPLFWFALFGLPGAVCYRLINTMDAMVGYRGRWEYAGKTAAVLDDLLNFVPARLTALLLLVAAIPGPLPARRGWQVLARDRRQTPSPNGGWPMAAMAGILGMCIEKEGEYRLGPAGMPATLQGLNQAWLVALGAAAVMLTLLFTGGVPWWG